MDYSKSTTASKVARISILIILLGTLGAVDASNFGTQTVSLIAVVPGAGTTNTPSGSSGGGGGGGGSGNSSDSLEESVVFRGVAYPGSIVSLFKNGVIAAQQPTSPDSTFEISLKGLRTGTYIFGLRGQDNQGNQSVMSTYTIYVTAGVGTIVKGIFIAPTLSIDKKEVRRGETLTVIGKATQNAQVTVVFNSETNLIKKTSVDENGNWFYKLDTLELEYGNHQVKARTVANNDFTSFSQSLSFKIGTQSIINDQKTSFNTHDVNKDGRVNLVDFSVLVYWYRRPNPPAIVDFNGDKKVNLIDFSLLVYNWTG